MWTSGSKIFVQPYIFIMHAVISDTYMYNKRKGCTEIILKDPGEDSGGKGKSKRAKKKKWREELPFFAPFLPLV